MPSKHPRSSRMAARRTNFTSKSDLRSEGKFIHDEVSTMSSTDDAPTHSAPSPTHAPSAVPSTNSASEPAEKKSLAQMMATYGSSNSSSNPAVWGYGENTHSTTFTVQDAEEQFPRLQVVPTERSPPTSQQSTVPSSCTTTACNAKVFIITSTDSDPSSDPSSDRRQARCCDSNLNANNPDGSR